jgi:hypothetical protein
VVLPVAREEQRVARVVLPVAPAEQRVVRALAPVVRLAGPQAEQRAPAPVVRLGRRAVLRARAAL